MKPKGIEAKESNEESKQVESTESDMSLIASSNSLNIRFYESSKDESDMSSEAPKIKKNSKSKNSNEGREDSLEREDGLELHENEIKNPKVENKSIKTSAEEEKPELKKKVVSYSPIKKGYFERK